MSMHEVWRLSRDVPACCSTPSLFSGLVKGLALVAITICMHQCKHSSLVTRPICTLPLLRLVYPFNNNYSTTPHVL